MRTPLSVFALMLATFGIGTTEFVIMGLLQELSHSLSVSIPQAGSLISGYAIGVVFGGPVLIALGISFPRKGLLLALMAIFIGGNAIAAAASSFEMLMAARIITATCHGAFIGLASVVAADLVEPERRAQAVSLVFAGGAMANVFGAPLGTFIGQLFGWRATFWALVVIGLIALIGIVALVPAKRNAETPRLHSELMVFGRLEVLNALAMTAFSLGALFAAFTYVSPLLTEVSGFEPRFIAPLLALFGVGLVLGNHFGGVLADRGLLKTLAAALAGLIASLTLLSFVAPYQIPAAISLFLVGVAGFATVPCLMTLAISKAGNAPTLAAVVTVSASNVGIALGAHLGGAAIDAGYGYTSPNWIGAMLAAGGLILAMLAIAFGKREQTA